MEMREIEDVLMNITSSESTATATSKGESIYDCLEFLVTHARSDHGRANLTQAGLLNHLLDYLRCLIIDEHCNDPRLVHLVLKLIRNLCAGEMSNQLGFVRQGGLGLISALFNQLISGREQDSDTENLERMTMQLLGNVSQAGEEPQSAIWRELFPTGFLDYARIGNPKLQEFLSMVIYTCCRDNRACLDDVVGKTGSGVFASMLRASQTASDFEGHWLELLTVKACLEEPCFEILFLNLGIELQSGSAKVETTDFFTLEQTYLLHVIAVIFDYQSQYVKRLVNSREFRPVLRGFVASLTKIIQAVVRCIGSSSVQHLSLPTGVPAVDILGYCLSILKDIFAFEDPDNREEEVEEEGSLVPADLISLLLELLRDLGPPDLVRKAEEHARKESLKRNMVSLDSMDASNCMANENAEKQTHVCSASSQGPKEECGIFAHDAKKYYYKGFRRDLVAVLANSVFRRKHVQHRIRELNGIFVILQQCVLDEKNPFLKEWGLWAVRNLLEGNEQNQQELAQLQLQDTVNTPAITQMGFKIEFDQAKRRPRLVNLSS